jgi:uncharacterized membrane-anchored protein
MIVERKWLWPLLGGVAFLQSAALFHMVYQRHSLLKSGREITLAVRPLDPRDLFRGDYVTLGYDISTLTKSETETDPDYSGLVSGSDVFVTLAPKTEGGWTITHAGSRYPSEVAPGEVVLKGVVLSVWKTQDPAVTTVNVRYGIEQYFVPEGTGRALEDKVRTHKIDAILAVGSDGGAAIKGLIVDGERHEDPPLL